MRRVGVALGVGLTTLVFVAAASADPMPVTSVYPENGATYSLPSGSIAFQLTSPVLHMRSMYVEVATRNSPLGQDGTLADDFQTDFFPLGESDAYPGTYKGGSNYLPNGAWWASTPGTYYWDVMAQYYDFSSGFPTIKYYNSPVYSFTLVDPQPPSGGGGGGAGSTGSGGGGGDGSTGSGSSGTPYLSKSRARSALPRVIRDESKHRAYNLRRSCTRRARNRIRCSVSWRTTRHPRASTWGYAGNMSFENIANVGLDYVFSGVRVRASCLSRKSRKRCTRRVHWNG